MIPDFSAEQLTWLREQPGPIRRILADAVAVAVLAAIPAPAQPPPPPVPEPVLPTLTSPDGTVFNLIVDDTGALTAEPVSV